MASYRIYGKHKDDKQFLAMDLGRGVFVKNLIYASIIEESEKEKAETEVNYMNDSNPDFTFELRKM